MADIAALGTCGAAWLLCALGLALDLTGRLPFRHRRGAGGFRPSATAGLALMTAVVLTQIAALRDWPRTVREALDLLDIVVALGVIVVAVLTATTRSRLAQASHAADAPRRPLTVESEPGGRQQLRLGS
ncbi:MAG TPA: hypothetical protein VGI66_16215 [Streptosporangiaceae bacterium]